jgi:hypothetical protein
MFGHSSQLIALNKAHSHLSIYIIYDESTRDVALGIIKVLGLDELLP